MLASRRIGLRDPAAPRRVSVVVRPTVFRQGLDREAYGRNSPAYWEDIRSNDLFSSDPVGSLVLSMLTRNCLPRRPGLRPAVFMLSLTSFATCSGRVSPQVRGSNRCNEHCHGPQDQQKVRKLLFSTVGKAQVMVDLTWSQLLCSFSRSQDRCCERCAFERFLRGFLSDRGSAEGENQEVQRSEPARWTVSAAHRIRC